MMYTILLAPGLLVVFGAAWFASCLFSYLRDPKGLRRYPAPSVAGLTNLWIMWKNYVHTRSQLIYDAHMSKGPIIRIGPNHLSFISPEAIRDIYGHRTVCVKDKFYEIFVGSHNHVLDVVDKETHGRKRKLFAAALSQKSVEEKEHSITEDIRQLVVQFDRLATAPPKPGQDRFPDSEMTDVRRWFNILMLDLICDLTYSKKMNFVKKGDDYTTCEKLDGTLYQSRIEELINPNAQLISTIGFSSNQYMAKKALQWHKGNQCGVVFTDWIIHMIRQRFQLEKEGKGQGDFFHSLTFTKDGMPVGMELGELVAELSLLTNAGSETTTAALQNIMHNLCRNPHCMDKLYEEIASVTTDEELEENPVVPYDKIKFLPYLRAVIDETLRDRPSLSIGLPRVTPNEGTHIAGTWVPGNTTVSIPTWAMHHDPAVFERPFEFLPERWLGESGQQLQKYMLAFSAGSRQCVGRNVAYTEISMIISSIIRRYRFALPSPEWKPTVYETMVIRSGPMPMKIWRR